MSLDTYTHTHTLRKLKSAIHGRTNELAAAHGVPAATTKLVFPRRRECQSRQTDNQEESKGGKGERRGRGREGDGGEREEG